MKKPKKTRRYCPFCNAHTEQKVSLVSSGHKRGTMKKGSIERARLRGRGRGYGNLGKWGSKPAVTAWKRKTKSTKKMNVMYTCLKCNKSILQKKGVRTSKMTIEEKKKE
jgi:large subunit ribosomal protein L44e